MAEKKKFERLPSSVRPELYDLCLKPSLNTFKFEGKEIVSLKILQPTDKIVFNSVDLEIEVVQLKVLPAGESLIPEFSLCAKDETVTLKFPEVLPVGDAELTIVFSGELNDKMRGFYRSKYTKTTGEKEEYFAVTQFESTEARRCFPCWDEPAIKARFDVTLIVDPTKVALSNMPVEKECQNSDGLKVVRFSRTPIMSTYLLAFVVGDFEYVEDTSSDGVLVRVYAPPGKKEQGRFALFVTTKILPFYKEYFQIAYPLPKIDLIAVSEMAPGAMENWGLITFRETHILVDEANTSASTRQTVAIVVGHELAHMWFGNLVTMEWWTHLWLNEGYATFVEFLCVDYLFPEYDIWTQFVTDSHCVALELDALKSSHPIEVPVGHPSEVDEIFDNISYNKGSAVIRMLHKFIGDDDFRKGMNIYLTRHQYGNTFTEDLWAALEEASSKPIKSVMSTWTKQMGFPVITVESSVQENNSRTLVLSQHKFCAEANRSDDESTWIVPLSFCKKSKPTEDCYSMILSDRQATITIPDVAPEEWIKLNPSTVGFYRTKYPTQLLQQFVPSIKNKSLPPLDRLGLVDDLFALILSGQAKTTDGLELIQSMKDEDNFTVWANIAEYLEKIHQLLYNTDFEHLFSAYGLQIVKPIYQKLGHENKPDEKHLTTLLRSLVLNRLVKFSDKEFAKVALEKFEKHIKGTKVIPADLRSVIYRAAISADGKKAFTSLIHLFTTTDMQEEKDRILRSFTAVTDVTLVDDILEFTLSEKVTTSSAVTAISSIATSKVGRDKTWEFLQKNFDFFNEKLVGGWLLTYLVKRVTENFASEERAKEIETFFSTKNVISLERTSQQSLETVRNRAAWLRRDKESIKSYLEKL